MLIFIQFDQTKQSMSLHDLLKWTMFDWVSNKIDGNLIKYKKWR